MQVAGNALTLLAHAFDIGVSGFNKALDHVAQCFGGFHVIPSETTPPELGMAAIEARCAGQGRQAKQASIAGKTRGRDRFRIKFNGQGPETGLQCRFPAPGPFRRTGREGQIRSKTQNLPAFAPPPSLAPP